MSAIPFATPYAVARRDALNLFRSMIGPSEDPPGSNRTWYGKRYGWDGVYYCVQAIWSILDATGSDAGIKKTASTGDLYNWGVARGRRRTKPESGDIVIVTKNGVTKHVDMVESYKDGKLICIGANTSNGFGSTDNGGGTYRNDRTAWLKKGLGSKNGWAIRAFIRPFYGLNQNGIRAIQKKAGITVDGKIGPNTINAVKVLQRQHGLKADGFPGPTTMTAIFGGSSIPNPSPSKKAPAFPLPKGFYYGSPSGPVQSVSGRTRNSRVPSDVVKDSNGRYYSKGLKLAQQELKRRGWDITADGRWGDETDRVVLQFKKNKKGWNDSDLGPETWKLIFELPVT